MKRVNAFVIVFLSCLILKAQPQSQIVGFEDLSLPVDSFYNGKDQAGGFQSGSAFFPNSYHAVWDFWESGWAYSSRTDSGSIGSQGIYTAITGGGFQSATYAIGQQMAVIHLDTPYAGLGVYGFFVTNTAYAYHSMKNGDGIGKKFGGVTGNDPDFFALTVKRWYNGQLHHNDSVTFYLADFRDTNNNNDYILNTWESVVLAPMLGNADSLLFILSSSDTGAFGYNTPLFFAIDYLGLAGHGASVEEGGLTKALPVYPNPFRDRIRLDIPSDRTEVKVFDSRGVLVMAKNNVNELDLSALVPGVYLVKAKQEGQIYQSRIVKQ